MKKYIKLILIASFLNLSGCAFMPDNYIDPKPIDSNQLSKVSTIALLDVATPSKYWMGSPVSGVASGLFGPLASLGAAKHDDHEVFRRLNFPSTTTNNLKSALEKAGYKVINISAVRPVKSKLLKDFSVFSDIKADAILDVAPGRIGYEEEMGKTHFKEGELGTTVSLAFNLVSVVNHEVIANGYVNYSTFDYAFVTHSGKSPNFTYKVGPKEHIFKDRESLSNDIEEAEKRMEYAVIESTKMLAEFLIEHSR